jgi:hypothetical protein
MKEIVTTVAEETGVFLAQWPISLRRPARGRSIFETF